MDFDSRLYSRVAVVEALRDLPEAAAGGRRVNALQIADALERAAEGMRAERPAARTEAESHEVQGDEEETVPALAAAYDAYAALASGMAHLARWVHAVRTAEMDADRFRRAARVAAADAKRRLEANPPDLLLTETLQGMTAAADAISAVDDIDQVVAAGEFILRVTLPLPVVEERSRKLRVPRGVARVAAESGLESEPPAELPPPVAFLTFWLNGVIVGDPQLIHPDVLYDLELQLQLSRWPRDWYAIEFVPLHVEPSDILQAPVFRFEQAEIPQSSKGAPSDNAPVTLRGIGRLRVHAPLDLLARPLEVRYVGQGIGESTAITEGRQARARSEALSIQGQTHLRLQSYDPASNPITGFHTIDERILQLRDTVRLQGVPDRELKDFLTLLAGTSMVSAQALADDLYPGVWPEDRFQKDIRGRLRAIPTIGGELEEHAHAAGGITDLSFHKIRLELKVQDDAPATLDQVMNRYGQQTAQYIVGSDRRCGVLAVLDSTRKTAAPGDPANDVDVIALPPPNGSGRSIVLGVVIVRGNLPTPSHLSRSHR